MRRLDRFGLLSCACMWLWLQPTTGEAQGLASTSASTSARFVNAQLSLSGTAMPTSPLALRAPLAYMDEPAPSTGTGKIVVGWVALGIGALNLITLPVCFADFYPRDAEGLCVGLSATLGGVGIALGVPFLIVGYNNRADYKRWRESHPAWSALLNTRLSASNDSALLLYSGTL